MKEKQKIAIIGAALKYPYADNFKDLIVFMIFLKREEN